MTVPYILKIRQRNKEQWKGATKLKLQKTAQKLCSLIHLHAAARSVLAAKLFLSKSEAMQRAFRNRTCFPEARTAQERASSEERAIPVHFCIVQNCSAHPDKSSGTQWALQKDRCGKTEGFLETTKKSYILNNISNLDSPWISNSCMKLVCYFLPCSIALFA